MILVATAAAISNGTEVEEGVHPETVMVLRGGFCTGALIRPSVVLTSANCFNDVNLALVPDGNTSVLTGSHSSSPDQVVEAERVVVHPAYRSIGPDQNSVGEAVNQSENDVALVFLAEPLPGPPLALNDAPVFLGMPLNLVGYGFTTREISDGGVKREVVVPVSEVTDTTLETFGDAPGNTCLGDVGAPGLVRVGERPVQVSVTSNHGCETSPSHHMRVDAYVDWIQETLAPDAAETVSVPAPPTFLCSNQLPDGSGAMGTAPMELRCEVTMGPELLLSATWDWGDGTTDTVAGTRATHPYTEPGTYSVSACIVRLEGAGTQEDCISKPGEVRVCEAPVASFEASVEGRVVTLTNRTPSGVLGCLDEAVWEVYAGETASGEPLETHLGWEPELELDPGEYTVVLNVQGFSGVDAASLTVNVSRIGGCAHVPWGGSLGVMGVLLLMSLARGDGAD